MSRSNSPRTSRASAANSAIRRTAPLAPLDDATRRERAGEIAKKCFGSPGLADRVVEVVDVAARMKAGAANQGRPAPRRDKLAAAAAAARKLLQHLSDIDEAFLLALLGPPRTAETTVIHTDAELAAMPDLPAGPVYLGLTPQAQTFLGSTRSNVAVLAGLLEAAAGKERAGNPGAPVTPDATRFLIEALAGLWTSAKGIPPHDASTKRGGFGDLVKQTAALRAEAFPSDEVSTALRRYIEARRKG